MMSCNPSHDLSGVKVTEEGFFAPDWKSFSLPDYYQTTEYSKLSASDKKKSDKFFQDLAKKTGRTVSSLYQDRNKQVPKGDFVLLLTAALRDAAGIDASDASALANLTGGGALAKNFLGNWTEKPLTPDDYTDPEKLRALYSNTILSEALRRLKANNPGAHEYIVRLIGAKAANRAAQISVQVGKDQQKVIDKELELAKKAAEIPLNVAKGALDTASAAGKALSYLPWILGGTLVLGAYLVYRNRDTVKQAASKALTRGLL